MNRRSFIKALSFIPAVSLFSGRNVFGMSRQNGLNGISNSESGTLASIFVDNTAPRLIVVAARPSMGKTSFLLNLLNEVGLNKNERCLYFSLENTREALLTRLMAIRSGVPISKIEKGQLDSSEWGQIMGVTDKIAKSKIYINDAGTIDIEEIKSQVLDHQQQYQNVRYVFVDYFQLFRTGNGYPSRDAYLKDTLKQMNKMARELNIVVVLAAQLNRGVELRKNRRPIPQDLREVRDLSSIDELVLLYRDNYYDQDNANNTMEISRLTSKFKTDSIYFAEMSNSNLLITNVRRRV